MKKVKRAIRIVFGMGLTAVLIFGMAFAAFAADTTDINLSQKGSISLTLYSDEAQAAVEDGALTLYEVADLKLDDGNMAYDKTSAFAGYSGTLDVEDDALAQSLADYVTANGISGTEAAIASDGSVRFSDLTLGLYLIIQTTESTGYYAIDPFVVTVPIEENGAWVYSVDASPKVQVYPNTETPPGTQNPIPGSNPNSNPSDTGGTSGTGGTGGTSGTSGTGGTGGTSGTGGSGGTSGTLPQTGQLFWPIPVLACCGAFLFLLGAGLRRRKHAA